MEQKQWIVHKFGGTSMGSTEAIRRVLELIESESEHRVAVVVSAMSGVTDRLINAALGASRQDPAYENQLMELLAHHARAAQELLRDSALEAFEKFLTADFKDLREILRGVWLSKHLPETTLEMVSGYGELWSSKLLALLWTSKKKDVAWVDARAILVVESGETGPLLLWPRCQKNLDFLCAETKSHHLVITGFIASTPEGVPTTLKRNGSDFSASIFGRLLRSREIIIWTDVDGVFSADPRKVPEAECLSEISYEEAIELAYFGAKVIHPHTMGPAVELNIPIVIKNTFNPKAPGTTIHQVSQRNDGRVARGFTTVDQVSLINVEGTGMIGVPGVAQRLFGSLREVGVSVILISQASSEHSICFVVPSLQAEKAKIALERAFQAELSHGQVECIEVISDCSVLAMVGDNMVKQSGVAGRFFAALGNAGISVKAIAQGSSERNISVVIAQTDAIRALRVAHSAFFLSNFTISIGLIGPGLIGKALLKQLFQNNEFLKKEHRLDLRVRAVASSQKMLFHSKQLLEETFKRDWEDSTETLHLERFGQHVESEGLPHTLIVDCTSSEEIANQYSAWLQRGIHVITPNKKAGSGSLKRFNEIKDAQKKNRAHFLYEATVGAGLPVISTLRDLIQTGDKIISIEGVFSGTLSYLFSEFNPRRAFSEVVFKAKHYGFTEPDPRDDLNGLDVARKVVILAREAGFALNLESVQVESLVPPALMKLHSVDEFMARLSELDAEMKAKIEHAEQRELVLRYTGSVHASGEAKVELREYPKTHPFSRLKGTDNIIAFRTQRYDQQPLIVQGPGAGPEVTAGGIFADILRLARSLGAQA